MPTPVAHSLAGLAIHTGTRKPGLPQTARLLYLIALANLPDVDFIPGYLVGNPARYHWGPTHSLFAALVAGAVSAAFATRRQHRFVPVFALAGFTYLSHILLDLVTGRAINPSIGLELFWPFSNARYLANWPVFQMAPHSIVYEGPLQALFSREILPVIARELAVMIPVVALAWAIPAYRAARTQRHTAK
jgi:inner membrane protein